MNEDLKLAIELARIAEREILPRYRQVGVDIKPDGTEVTEADRRAERVMRDHLAKVRPNDAVLGEEFGGTLGGGRCWVLDPVDGTAWFTLGMPLFGTLVALVVDKEPVAGVIHLPAIGETVYANRGDGCWFTSPGADPQRVHVSASASLHACIGSASGLHGSSSAPMAGLPAYEIAGLQACAQKFRFCGDCGQHGMVARGRLHFAIDTVMKPWDIAAIVPCVEEAGGVVSSTQGVRQGILTGGSLLSAASAQVRDEVVRAIAPR
ncbi:MAG: inositol phosphatase [Clostridia bacterium]|nr:inositol phosphatase [Deltaproteobacteria bacterium]